MIQRIFQSLRDGSFPYRVLNRFSRVKYGPIAELTTTEVLEKFHPGGPWRGMSAGARSPWLKLHEVFESVNIKTILWIGAHDGDDAVLLNEAFPGREFHLLEPVAETFARLEQNLADHPNMHPWRLAAGASEGEMEMFVDECSASSSLLPYENVTLERFPFLGKQTRQIVRIRPVDTLVREWGCPQVELMVIDVQGFEDVVLRGAEQTLTTCGAVIIEMSLQQFYVGSSTFESVYDALTKAGFKLRGITMAHRDARNQISQIDGLFLRS